MCLPTTVGAFTTISCKGVYLQLNNIMCTWHYSKNQWYGIVIYNIYENLDVTYIPLID